MKRRIEYIEFGQLHGLILGKNWLILIIDCTHFSNEHCFTRYFQQLWLTLRIFSQIITISYKKTKKKEYGNNRRLDHFTCDAIVKRRKLCCPFVHRVVPRAASIFSIKFQNLIHLIYPSVDRIIQDTGNQQIFYFISVDVEFSRNERYVYSGIWFD